MKINFEKYIRGRNNLKDFIEEFEPTPILSTGWWFPLIIDHEIIRVKYNIQGIISKLGKELSDRLKQEGHELTQTDSGGYWCSGPEQFSLTINGKYRGEGMLDEVAKEQIDTKQKWFRRIPVYRTIPEVDIDGTIAFEEIIDVDPKSVLEVLTNLEYGSEVITTTQELGEVKQTKLSDSSKEVYSFSLL